MRRAAANLLTREEARRIAINFAKLPELLGAVRPDANALSSGGLGMELSARKWN